MPRINELIPSGTLLFVRKRADPLGVGGADDPLGGSDLETIEPTVAGVKRPARRDEALTVGLRGAGRSEGQCGVRRR